MSQQYDGFDSLAGMIRLRSHADKSVAEMVHGDDAISHYN